MPELLSETTTRTLVREGAGFRAVMITPGQGSSGIYSEEMLRRDAQIAFPPGTKAFIDHPTEQNPGRSVRNMIGTYPEGGVYEDGVGIVSKLVPYPHMVEFISAVAPDAALSIYAMGEKDSNGNITALLPDVQNSVDLVAYPGRPGSGLSAMYESAISAYESATQLAATLAEEKKDKTMTPEQEAILTGLVTAFEAFVAKTETDASARAQESVDAKVASDAADARVKATVVALEAVNKADLPDALRANLVSAVEAGNTDITPALESAIAIWSAAESAAAAKSPAVAPLGFVHATESADDKTRNTEFDALFGGK